MQLKGRVDKGWGYENIWVSTDKYCSKFLHFESGKKFSMHFHAVKEETWYVVSGKFEVVCIETADASRVAKILRVGDVWHNRPLVPHQVKCIEAGVILEVSTADSVEDNYRVEPGDSQ
jgi:mannose-6-phosphate isomerase-like protein (cupin superfamily)